MVSFLNGLSQEHDSVQYRRSDMCRHQFQIRVAFLLQRYIGQVFAKSRWALEQSQARG